ENEKDLEEIPENVARKLRFELVGEMDAVLSLAMADEAGTAAKTAG
ncbi:MAG: S16 family serine protease, partial [Patescibacteria group bacterium]